MSVKKIIGLFLITVLFVSGRNNNSTPDDFDSELSRIARNFRESIWDKDECTRLYHRFNYIKNDIENTMDDDDLIVEDRARLKQLKFEAEALEKYIGAVGDCSNTFPSIDEFYKANERVRATITYSTKDKFCIDILKVSIEDYSCYLAINNSSSNFRVKYVYQSAKAPNGVIYKSGNGEFGVGGKELRGIYSNRERPSMGEKKKVGKPIYFTSLTCKPF